MVFNRVALIALLPVMLAAAGDAQEDVAADRIAPPPPGNGQVVFYRRGDYLGRAISCAVRENNILLTHLPPGRFGVVNIPAGVHNFVVSSEKSDVMRVEVEPGQRYYGVCTVVLGFFAGRPQLTLVSRDTFFATAPKLKPVTGTVLADYAVPAAPSLPAAVPIPTVSAAPAAVAAEPQTVGIKPAIDAANTVAPASVASSVAPVTLPAAPVAVFVPAAASTVRPVSGTAEPSVSRSAPVSRADERDIPPASAYVPPPAEIFIKTLPPRP